MKKLDGFYSAFMTGSQGQGFAMLIFKKGKIVGADLLGVTYDGDIKKISKDSYVANIKVTVPRGVFVISGKLNKEYDEHHNISITFDSNFDKLDFLRIETPNGPVNVRIRRIRYLEN